MGEDLEIEVLDGDQVNNKHKSVEKLTIEVLAEKHTEFHM